ncbi:MAG: hypothetical protein HY074_08255 [Deltaproteobacteria bacterium]|nr:hypothetical protein [Deltaproteobacteria bacterium]
MRKTFPATMPAGLLAALVLLTGCATTSPIATREALNQHVVRSDSYYQRYATSRLEDRVYPATQELIDYLLKDNAAEGFPNKPESAALAPEVVADIHAAIVGLPPAIQAMITAKVAGIFVVKDLGGSAYTDIVYSSDAARKPLKGVVILDISALNRKANEWLTWKESSPFKPEAPYSLQARLEQPDLDTRSSAIQFILLHEFAHALSIGENATPLWGLNPTEVADPAKFPFFSQSWQVQLPVAPASRGKYVSRFDKQMPLRAKVLYYLPLKTTLLAGQSVEIYEKLAQTNFLTLYGATNPFDDFAEAFATYVHGVLLKRPYRITITKAGKTLLTFTPCWNDRRCRSKREALERFIARAAR